MNQHVSTNEVRRSIYNRSFLKHADQQNRIRRNQREIEKKEQKEDSKPRTVKASWPSVVYVFLQDHNAHMADYRVHKLIQDAENERKAAELVAKFKTIDVYGSKSCASIIKGVSQETGFSVQDIIGPRRSKAVVQARYKAIVAVAKQRPDLSLPAIGREFNRDHTTIIHALRKAGYDRVSTYHKQGAA